MLKDATETETRKSLKSFLKSFSLSDSAASTFYFVPGERGREAKDVIHSLKKLIKVLSIN